MKSISCWGKTIHLHVLHVSFSSKNMRILHYFSYRFFDRIIIFFVFLRGSISVSILDRIFEGKRLQNDLQNRSPGRPLRPKRHPRGLDTEVREPSPSRPFFGHRFLDAFWPPFGTVLVNIGPFWLHFGPCWLHFGPCWLHVGPFWLHFGSILDAPG